MPFSDRGRNMTPAERQAEMDQHDIIIGRKRLRYDDTPPTSPDIMGGMGSRTLRDMPSRDCQDQQRVPDRHQVRDDYPDLGLRLTLTGLSLPHSVFDWLEERMLELRAESTKRKKTEKLVRTRDHEIAIRRKEIRRGKEANEQLKDDLARLQRLVQGNDAENKDLQLKAERAARVEDTQMIKELQKENEELKQDADTMSGLLKFNSHAHEDKRMQMEGLVMELASMREMVDAKDRCLSTMEWNLQALANASTDDTLPLALEAQAQRTLGMVRGLQADVKDRVGAIEELQGMLAERDATIEAQNEQLKAIETAEKRAVAAEERAAEARALTEKQQKIVSKLLMQRKDEAKFFQNYAGPD